MQTYKSENKHDSQINCVKWWQAKCIQDDLWHLAIVSKRSSLKITWKDDYCLKINILLKRRSGVKKKKKRLTSGVIERERGREEWDKGRLKGTIRPWKEGFSWCSTDPMKLGQTHLSLSLVSQSFQRRSTHGGVHVSHMHTHARPRTHTHTQANTVGHSPEVIMPGLCGSWVMASCGWHGNHMNLQQASIVEIPLTLETHFSILSALTKFIRDTACALPNSLSVYSNAITP